MKRSKNVTFKNTSSKPLEDRSNVEAKDSLLMLSDICLLQIFQFVKFDDLTNLSETCTRLRRVADVTLLETKKDVKRSDHYYFVPHSDLNRLFTQIGHRLKSLVFNFGVEYNDMTVIMQNCPQLKNVTCNVTCLAKSGHVLEHFGNAEMLRLSKCCDGADFFKSFRKLNSPNIADCGDIVSDWTMSFKNYFETESCILKGDVFPAFGLLQLVPNLKILYLTIDRDLQGVEFKQLLQLRDLTALKLRCSSSEDVNNFIDIMESFEKLQVLVLVGYVDLYSNWRPTIWPQNLKHLTLEMVQISFNVFMSTIRQLGNLESIDVFRCETYVQVDDLEFLYRHVLNAMSVNQPKLNVFVPMELSWNNDLDMNEVDSQNLRISRSRGEFINFPGWNE